MNLLQVRTKFRELSGRFDLVNDDYSDNGADFFINEGSKFLDRLNENQKSWASSFRFIDVGMYAASIQHCRAIKEVWAASTTARWQLEKKSIQELIEDHLLGTPSERTSGEPAYYSPTITRYSEEDLSAEDFESFIQWVEIPSGNAYEYNTILLSAPVDRKIVVEVKGLFYSKQLTADTDENYWSVNHPLLLYMAAMRYVEVVNRNTQGVNDWERAIVEDASKIGMDLVEELIAERGEMEG
jgi:hypothetical protein